MAKQADPAGAMARLLQDAFWAWAGGLRVALPCRILSYDQATQTATVLPLIKTGDDDPAPIESVPALGQRFMIGGYETYCPPALHTGDVVLVVFADREIKTAIRGQPVVPEFNRQHSIMDGVIVGVFGG